MGRIAVRVTPGARDDAVGGWQAGSLQVRVRASPQRGKANEAVCRLIAAALGIPKGRVTIERGAILRRKIIEVEGIEEGELRRRLSKPAR